MQRHVGWHASLKPAAHGLEHVARLRIHTVEHHDPKETRCVAVFGGIGGGGGGGGRAAAAEDMIEATTVEVFGMLGLLCDRNVVAALAHSGGGTASNQSPLLLERILPRAVEFMTNDMRVLVSHTTTSGMQPLTHLTLLRFLLRHGGRVGMDHVVKSAFHLSLIHI